MQTMSNPNTAIDALRVHLYIATILTVAGCLLLVGGFLVDPKGEIHSSVLVAFGEIMTFVAALLGINYTYKVRELRGK
jgi:hypothetical protein